MQDLTDWEKWMKHKFSAGLLALFLCAGCVQTDFSDQQYDLPGMQPPVSSDISSSKPEPEPQHTLQLAYQADDTLNPYTMTSEINRMLIPLLYDSLVRLDTTRRPEPVIASEVTMTQETCTVRLRENILFSDGTRVTGADIVYSAELARGAGSSWAPTLSSVSEVSVNEAGEVVFRLGRADIDFPALLTFPIVKDGTGGAEFPIGVSRYLVFGTSGGGLLLRQNPIYSRAQGNREEIRLVNMDDENALSFGLKAGDLDLVYSDLSTPELSNLSGSNVAVPLNHLVFVGINGTKGLLAKPEFRHAISLAINRDQLAARAYMGRADAANEPFHPFFYRLEESDLSTAGDLTRAEALLDGLALEQKNEQGWRLQQGKPVELSLLVNSENSVRNACASLLMEQLAEVGIKINIVSLPFSQYQDQLLYTGYDMYIGEVRLMDNMDFSMLLGGGRVGYNTAYSEELNERLKIYRSTGEQLRELCQMFTAQSPFIPLLFRQGQVSLGEQFSQQLQATEQDLFYNIADW